MCFQHLIWGTAFVTEEQPWTSEKGNASPCTACAADRGARQTPAFQTEESTSWVKSAELSDVGSHILEKVCYDYS